MLEIEGVQELVLAKLDSQLLPEHWPSSCAPSSFGIPNSSMSFSNPPYSFPALPTCLSSPEVQHLADPHSTLSFSKICSTLGICVCGIV